MIRVILYIVALPFILLLSFVLGILTGWSKGDREE